MSSTLQLYETAGSSSSWRVRCALNFKGIAYESKNADDAGENDEFVRTFNPSGRIPVLLHGERVITESLAIIEYLHETFPGPSLLPADPFTRALSRAIALHIVCGIEPLQNIRVREQIEEMVGDGALGKWSGHWMGRGLQELEELVSKSAEKYCVGDEITIADTCIPSIVERGRKWGVGIRQFPTLSRIDANLQQIDAFAAAHPCKQHNFTPL